jgi:hypothetical protein
LDALDGKRLHECGQAGCLPGGQAEHQAGQRRGVDDGVFERPVQAAAHQPGVERVVAMLDQHRPLRKAEEAAADIAELGSPDQHRAVDLVPAAGVRVDRGPAVDQRVEEGECRTQAEPLRAHFEDQERTVTRGLDVERHEVRLLEWRGSAHVGGVDRVLLPLDRSLRPARLQVERAHLHDAWPSIARI